MIIGIITDTHLHNWKNFDSISKAIGDAGVSKRLLEQEATILEAIHYFKLEGVSTIVHAGDWVHEVGSAKNEVLNVIRHIILVAESEDMVFISAGGNHDTPIRINPKPANLITTVIEAMTAQGFYESPTIKVINYYDTVDYDTVKGYDLVVLHKIPAGAKVGNFTFDEGVDWRRLASQNRLVVFGHIHQRQVLSSNCIIIGSPYHLTFGDEGERGVYTYDTDTSEVKFHKLKYPEFLTVEQPEEVKNDGNYYRVLCGNKRIDNPNVVTIIEPTYFEERIKSQTFEAILNEWVTLNGKDPSYVTEIADIAAEKLQLAKATFDGRLKEVHVKDFSSVGDVTYRVSNGFTLVTGSNDIFDSNGSGKSTLIGEAIYWALFGETTKGLSGDDVVRRGQKDCKVSIVLISEQCSYVITRSRKDGLEVMLIGQSDEENLTEGMKQIERQKVLEEKVLGFDKNLFLASCYFSQEHLMMLTGLSDSEKTNMITNLLGFEAYDSLSEKVKAKQDTLQLETRRIESEAIRIEQEIAVAVERCDGLSRQLLSITSTDIPAIEKKIAMEEEKQTGLRLELTSLAEPAISTTDVVQEIADLVSTEQSLLSNERAFREELQILKDGFSKAGSEYLLRKSEVVAVDAEIRRLNGEIDQLSQLSFGERCDKCGATISQENADIFIKEKKDKIVALHTPNLLVLTETVRDLSISKKQFEEDISDAQGRLDVAVKTLGFARSDLEKARRQLISAESLKRDFDFKCRDFVLKIGHCDSLISNYEEQITQLTDKSNGMSAAVAEAHEAIQFHKRRKVAGEALKAIQQKKADVLEFWKVAFSAKGIRAVLLDRFCNEFNRTVNIYLSLISNGSMSILLTPTKTTKGGDERNKIGMVISIDGNEVKYESLSGGEKRRVDVALCFGLNKFVSSRYALVSYGLLGIIILDEIFSYLDKAGEESVSQLLWNEGRNKAVFVVDHALGLSSYADKIWKVIKENGVSRLEVV